MKLRIRGDSLRLRLTQGEVAALVAQGCVEESVSFGVGQRLIYAIVCDGTADALSAKYAASRVEVALPVELARAWAASDEVALEGTQDSGEGRTLRLLVEKDFVCLKQRPHEDDEDAFPNPSASC